MQAITDSANLYWCSLSHKKLKKQKSTTDEVALCDEQDTKSGRGLTTKLVNCQAKLLNCVVIYGIRKLPALEKSAEPAAPEKEDDSKV